MAILPTDIRTLFTNYDIITYVLNLTSSSEHFIIIEHRILAILKACMPLKKYFKLAQIRSCTT
jgi:hypothetical protein